MIALMSTKHRYFFEMDYAVFPSWCHTSLILRDSSKETHQTPEVTPEVAPEVTPEVAGQVTGEVTGQVTGQVGGRAIGEFSVASSYEAIQAGGHSRSAFLQGVRLFTANPPSLCSACSILVGLFLHGLDVFKLQGNFENFFFRICSPVTLLLPAGIGGDRLCAVEACKQRWSGLEVMAGDDVRQPSFKHEGEGE